MSDLTAPIVLSIVSLATTLIVTLVGAYITYYSDERKARREAEKILLKYRDPLLLAAADLQARCWGICDSNLLEWAHPKGEQFYKDALYIYTAYVVGQYLSWVWILRRQAQFVALVSSSPPKWSLFNRKAANHATTLTQKIDAVRTAFATSGNPREKPFMMFKPHQQAVGEIMSCQDKNGEYYCMGFATFEQRWKNGAPQNLLEDGTHKAAMVTDHNDATGERMAGVNKLPDQIFREHFKTIEEGIDAMFKQRRQWKQEHPGEEVSHQGSDFRLRRLQHLLLDLVAHLDTTGTMLNGDETSPVNPAPQCKCSLSPCHCKRGCKICLRDRRGGIKEAKHCACTQCVPRMYRQGQGNRTGRNANGQVYNRNITSRGRSPRTSAGAEHERGGIVHEHERGGIVHEHERGGIVHDRERGGMV